MRSAELVCAASRRQAAKQFPFDACWCLEAKKSVQNPISFPRSTFACNQRGNLLIPEFNPEGIAKSCPVSERRTKRNLLSDKSSPEHLVDTAFNPEGIAKSSRGFERMSGTKWRTKRTPPEARQASSTLKGCQK